MLEHGGRLQQAARRYDIPLDQWLDLSTGINPNGWPVPPVPATAWARLPEEEDGLVEAARDYYESKHLLPVAGSQAAIQTLPALFSPLRVGILTPGYAEHERAWQRAGHQVRAVDPDTIPSSIEELEVLVLIHPNNPTGHRFTARELHDWHARLAARNGLLIVDEAFMDSTPQHSLLTSHRANGLPEGLVVLRSLGKFFGLAGARVGFVFAPPHLLDRLRDRLGPWALNGPARHIATKALQDRNWQTRTRLRLQADGERLKQLLTRNGLEPDGGCALFQWVRTDKSVPLHEALARRAILTRLFASPASLRFGLPGSNEGWQRLEKALWSSTQA